MLKPNRGSAGSASKSWKMRPRKAKQKRASESVVVGRLVTAISKEGTVLANRAERLKRKVSAQRGFKLRKMIAEQRRRLDALKRATEKLTLEVVRLEPEIGRDEVDSFVRPIELSELNSASFEVISRHRGSSPGERVSVLPIVDNSRAISTARRAGKSIKVEILSRDDMLTAEAAAHRIGKTRQSINNQRIAGKIIGLSFGDERFRYPEWQFHDNVYGRPLTKVLSALEEEPSWEKWRFFVSTNGMLSGRAPADAMMSGDIPLERIIRAAEAFARE